MLQEIIELQLRAADTDLSFPLHFHPLGEDGILLEDKKMTVSSFRVQHRIPCWGFLFREHRKPRKVDAEKAYAAGIPSEFFPRLKEGEDYILSDGSRIANEDVTKPGAKGASYAYCADTRYYEELADIIRDASLMYHEATYMEDQREKAALRFHSTAKQAATLALRSNAKKLLLGHFSSKYEVLEGFREEAATVFPNVEACREGVTYIA
jgi:ribonuclease Z